MPHNPQRLLVVQRADTLVVAVHAYASHHKARFRDLSPGLRNQLLRAVTSISLNLSEACGYHTSARTIALLDVAIGSCNEVERVLRLCTKLGIADTRSDLLVNDVVTVRRMTYGLRKRILQDERRESRDADDASRQSGFTVHNCLESQLDIRSRVGASPSLGIRA